MIKIRLTRRGKTNDPFYRIVAIDSHARREGKPKDLIGHWQPSTNDLKIDSQKVKDWLQKGAVISVGVQKLLKTK